MSGVITPNEIRRIATDVIVKPASFYQRMEKAGGLLLPIIFIVAMGVITGLLIMVLSALGIWGATEESARPSLGTVVLIPVVGVLGSFIGALIMMVIWKLMGSAENFETSFRCVAYSTAIWPVTLIIGLIPYIGTVIGTVWSLWLMICASSGAHNIPYRKALIVFGIIGAIWIFMSVSGELATRHIQSKYGDEIRDFQKSMENQEGMTTEELRQKMEEFRKTLQEKSTDQ